MPDTSKSIVVRLSSEDPIVPAQQVGHLDLSPMRRR